jgi:hypothetical protein
MKYQYLNVPIRVYKLQHKSNKMSLAFQIKGMYIRIE